MHRKGGWEVVSDTSGRGPGVRTRSAFRSRRPVPGKAAVGEGCPGAAAGWGECSVNLRLSLRVPSPQLLAEDTAGWEPRIRTCSSGAFAPFLGEGGVPDQLLGRADALLRSASIRWLCRSAPLAATRWYPQRWFPLAPQSPA